MEPIDKRGSTGVVARMPQISSETAWAERTRMCVSRTESATTSYTHCCRNAYQGVNATDPWQVIN